MFALIQSSDTVAEVCKEKFDVHPDLFWVDLGDHDVTPEQGWTYGDEGFIPPVIPEPEPPYMSDLEIRLAMLEDQMGGRPTKAEMKRKRKALNS